MPRVQRIIAQLPDLTGVRLACSVHLDLKMLLLVDGLLNRGAKLFVTTCNPATVRDEVVLQMRQRGAIVKARYKIPFKEQQVTFNEALEWQPTHLCEVGADLTYTHHQSQANVTSIRASLEATGSGVSRLTDLSLTYPIFNWDDVPLKEGLHNRYLVGLSTWHTFFARTQLTLHGKRVLVVGYGLVGRGLAASARAFGGRVTIAELDPVRATEAIYAGWSVQSLDQALPEADIIVTATGAAKVINADHLLSLREGAFLLNVGHRTDEIDVAALDVYPHYEIIPFVEEFKIEARTVYLFARGSMANLTAGEGDSLNAFDVTLATLATGIGYIVGDGAAQSPGVYMLPRTAWESVVQ